MQPIFKENNVRLIGVGVEPLGVEEFIEGKFFDGGERVKIFNILFLDLDMQFSLALSRTFCGQRQADVQKNGIPEIFIPVAVFALQVQKVDRFNLYGK